MSDTRKNMHGGVGRPKRFLRRHYTSRRPSGLQGISTGRKSLFSSRNTRTKADKHFGHKLFGKYASSRKSTIKNVSMSNGVKIKRSAHASKASKKSKGSKASKSNAAMLNSAVRYAQTGRTAVRYAPSAANELAAVEAAKHRNRAAEQASARASRASRGRNGHMRNNNGRAQAASSSRSEAVRSGKRMSLAAVRRALFNAEASHSGHAAASGPRDPRDLLASQDSQDSQ
jgi:hypothetical protein